MKTYIVYVAGNEVGTVNASNQNTAETKAAKKYASEVAKLPKINGLFGQEKSPINPISVVYTEV
jgi:hypothetical protein